MSLDPDRLAATIVAAVIAKGIDLPGAATLAPVGATGKSGLEVIIDALADGVVTEIDAHYDGGGTDSILNSLVGPGVPRRDGAGDWSMALDLLTQAAGDARYATPASVTSAVATSQAMVLSALAATAATLQPLSDTLTEIVAAAAGGALGYLKRISSTVWNITSSVPWSDLSGVPSVTAGAGLTGGGSLVSAITLAVAFAGTGTANTVARSNHDHAGTYLADAPSDLLFYGRRNGAWVRPSTTDVSEGINLYYLDSRARAAISGTTPISYSSSTGVISHSIVDGYLHVPATGTTNNGRALLAGSTAGSMAWTSLSTSNISGLTGWATKAYTNGSTTDVAEGSNLYFTNARAIAAATPAAIGAIPLGAAGAIQLANGTTVPDISPFALLGSQGVGNAPVWVYPAVGASGSAGSATTVPVLSWNMYGMLSAATSTTISIPHTQVSDWASAIGGPYQPLENQRLSTTNSPTFSSLSVSNGATFAGGTGGFAAVAGGSTAVWFGYSGFNGSTPNFYGFNQWSDGGVIIGAPSGKTIFFPIGGASRFSLSSAGATVTGSLVASGTVSSSSGGNGAAIYNGAGGIVNGYGVFAHSAMAATTGYALAQSNVGDTWLNAASGKSIGLSINNGSALFSVSASQCAIPVANTTGSGGLVYISSSGVLSKSTSGSDLPGGPYLPTAGGTISGQVTFVGSGPYIAGGAGYDFLVSSTMSSALIRVGDGATTAAVSFPKIGTKSFEVAGDAQFNTSISLGGMTWLAPVYYSVSSGTMPTLSTGQACFLICDNSGGVSFYWTAPSAHGVRYRDGSATVSVAPSATMTLAANSKTFLLIGPPYSGAPYATLLVA